VPDLDFKGKPFVFAHHLSVPFRELVIDPKKSLAGPNGPSLDDNLIIHGDNLEALKALLPRYAGKVDVIYIDPPYNTGKEGWAYNDNVNAPAIRHWLGKTVDSEDLERHDKWLCMIWPRLQLLRELLSEKGVLFASIDDNEQSSLRAVLNEIFGENNWLGTLVWKNATDNNPTRIAIEHEYIHCYAKAIERIPREWNSTVSDAKARLKGVESQLSAAHADVEARKAAYKAWLTKHKTELWPLQGYDQIDEGGIFTESRSVHNPGREGYRWDLRNPQTGRNVRQPLFGYRFPESTRDEYLAAGRIIFPDNEDSIIRLKVYLSEYEEKLPSVVEIDGRAGASDLKALFPESKQPFKNAKPVSLLRHILSYVASQDAIVLDSFAGSGTTAHAVLDLNKIDGGRRRFILVEMEQYAHEMTAERVRRAVDHVGTPETFTYCDLGDPLDLERFFSGETSPAWDQVARYVVYTATGATLPKVPKQPPEDWFVGEAGGYRIHLLYKPDLAFMRGSDAAVSAQLADRIAKANTQRKPVLLYAAARFVSQKELSKQGITFCQLPYAIHRLLGDGPTGSTGNAP
jgi:adenine-specific DNA-methyltransferase